MLLPSLQRSPRRDGPDGRGMLEIHFPEILDFLIRPFHQINDGNTSPMKKTASLLLAVIISAFLSVDARSQTLRLWEGDAPGATGSEKTDIPEMTLHFPRERTEKMPAVLIIPGGGYKHLSAPGFFISQMTEMGFVCAAMKYRLPVNGYRQPYPLTDARRAFCTLRANAEKRGVDPDRIGILGWSSGGHVSTSLLVHHQLADEEKRDAIDQVDARPDFAVLFCPVVTMKEHAHTPSVARLLGPEPPQSLVDYYSNEEHVTADTPRTFLVHAADDRLVLPENSRQFYDALQKQGVNSKLLIYQEPCGHGIGNVADFWRQPLKQWLTEIDVLR